MANSEHDHDNDRDRDHANDNGDHERPGSKLATAPAAGGALTSLADLQKALANVNTTAIIGRTGLPMLLFKSREGSGTWGFGQKRTIPEEGSRWAINPLTFQWGAICFGPDKKVLDERLVSVSQPKPLIPKPSYLGFPWQEEWAVNMKCIDGTDAGVEVIYKANTDGGIKAIATMLDLVRNQINGSVQPDGKIPPDSKIAPIVLLEKDSYPNKEFGRINIPVLTNVGWMSLDGPAPAPAPAPAPEPPPTEQPRRRRVG